VQKLRNVNVSSNIEGKRVNSPSAKAVGAAVALEAVLLPHVAALHHLENPLAAAMGDQPVTDAVAVAEAPVSELGVFVETMVGTAIGNAWQDCKVSDFIERLVSNGEIGKTYSR
jgi:hypothetical protein